MSSLFTSTPDRGNSVPFAALASSRSRVVLLGTPESGHDRILGSLRSLTFEHVTVSALIEAECERPSATALRAARSTGSPPPDALVLPLVRKWFGSRRSGRGFLLEGFPATLGQALILDEWLDARGEALDQVLLFSGPGSRVPDEVVTHYERQALLTRCHSGESGNGGSRREPAVVLVG